MSTNVDDNEVIYKDYSETLSSTEEGEQVITQKVLKRKHEDDVDEINKKFCIKKSAEDFLASPDPKPIDKPSSSRKDVDVDPEELNNILNDIDEEDIEDNLGKVAKRNKLSRSNVKNILKHVITNEYVLSMVRNTMKIDSGEMELEEAQFEPKLTRLKAKELMQNQFSVFLPAPSPMKKRDIITQKLLEEEFPEESSDDEDYKPNEEEAHSDDDNLASPRTSDLFSPYTNVSELSPAPVENVIEQFADEDQDLMIVLPADLDPQSETSEADKIALRTRSKLKLTDTPLEEIEASFMAPDITPDLYDTYIDDENWLKFLATLTKGTDSKTEHQDEHDDEETDPPFVFQEEAPDPLEFDGDQVSKRELTLLEQELNALMAETFQHECFDFEDEEEEDPKNSSGIYESAFTPTSDASRETHSDWMDSDDKLQLEEQLRMYIQLLTQAFLLSHGSPDLQFLNISSKLFMEEIKMFASRGILGSKKSVFNAHNLDGSLKLIKKFEKFSVTPNPEPKEGRIRFLPVPLYAKRTIATSKVFIYPELLPSCGFPKPYVCRKAVFTGSEDNLIAIGLEQFPNNESKLSNIQNLLLPCKTVMQIKVRIKNCSNTKVPLDNPIKHYLLHQVAPPYQRIVRIFDPDNIKIPAEYPLEVLPKWMTFYNRIASGHPMFVPPPIAPQPTMQHTVPPPPTVPPVAVVRPMFRKMPEKRKSRLILPHGAVFSPMKQIRPLLKKYNNPKRAITVLPFTVTCPLKEKCNHLLKKTCTHCSDVQKINLTPKLRTIKPKPNLETDENQSDSSICSESSVVQQVPLKDTVTCPQPLNTIAKPASNQNSVIVELNGAGDMLKNSLSAQDVSYNVPSENNTVPDSEAHSETENKSSSNILFSKSCETAVEADLDENLEDDELDASAVASVASKKQTTSKKKNRIYKDLESSLTLLKPSMLRDDPKKEEREILYVNSYLLRAAETLKNEPDIWSLFLTSICKYQQCTKFPVKLYFELKVILKNYPSLLEDFVAFLKPAEAKLVGKFKQYLMLNKIREFLRKVEIHFNNQPHHIPRIVRALSQFRQQSYVTSAEALSGLLPLLRNQTHLIEELTQLIPDAAPAV